MSSKPDYTPEEWALLARAPFMVGLIVTLAAPSGITGVLEEGSAVTRALTLAFGDRHTEPLLKSLVADIEASEGRLARPAERLHPDDAQTIAFETLEAVAEVLGRKAASGEAHAFKTWLLEIARQSAEAAKEGGFMGFGGVRVNEAEEAALSRIRAALRV